MSEVAFVALGANLGDALGALRRAREDLAALGTLTGVSALYRTAPLGGPPGQPDYLNAAVRLETALAAGDLLVALHAAEARAGRVRRARWGARTLDLDLLLYGARVSPDPRLDAVTVRVHKPFAPLPGVFRDVYAELTLRQGEVRSIR